MQKQLVKILWQFWKMQNRLKLKTTC